MFTNRTALSQPVQTPPRGALARRSGQLLACILCGAGLAAQTHAAPVALEAAERCALPVLSTVTSTWSFSASGDLGVLSSTGAPSVSSTNKGNERSKFVRSNQRGPLWAGQRNRRANSAKFDRPSRGVSALTLSPALYQFDTTVQLTSTINVDSVGDAVFEFYLELTTSYSAPSDSSDDSETVNAVSWQVSGSSTLTTGTASDDEVPVTPNNPTPTTCVVVSEPVIVPDCVEVVVIDDVSVPEPTTLSMLLLGSLALIRRGTRAS